MTVLFVNSSSVWPILGLLAVVGHSPELARQFVMSLPHQRNGMLRWPASSIVTIVTLYLNKDVFYTTTNYHGKREYQEPVMFRILFTHLRHIHRWNGNELNWAGYIRRMFLCSTIFMVGKAFFIFKIFATALSKSPFPPTLLIIRDG